MHNLHNLHYSFIFSAQRAVVVILILFQTYTTIHCGQFMGLRHCGQVHHQTLSGLSQPARNQANFLQLLLYLLSAVVHPFSALSHDAMDLAGDLTDEDLCFACVSQVESRHQPRNSSSNFADIGISRSFASMPLRMWITMRWLSMSSSMIRAAYALRARVA